MTSDCIERFSVLLENYCHFRVARDSVFEKDSVAAIMAVSNVKRRNREMTSETAEHP